MIPTSWEIDIKIEMGAETRFKIQKKRCIEGGWGEGGGLRGQDNKSENPKIKEGGKGGPWASERQ